MTARPGGPPPGPEPVAGTPFPRRLLAGDSLAAARALLGARLVRDGPATRVGRIVEVEAYIGEADLASHARMGPTDRNRVMFGAPGFAYVYLVYGMYHCLNVVTGPSGHPAALLVRAVEPVSGAAAMRDARERFRGRQAGATRPTDARLAAGPGLVGVAFDIDRSCTGLDLCDPGSRLRLEAAPATERAAGIRVTATPRIGIAYAGEPWVSAPWRLLVADSPSVSRRHS
jgi:DNA-3-methyladenine glycosylase